MSILEFTGTIHATSRDGRSGVVALDPTVSGKKYAVISPDTRGRIALMNGKGFLETGTHVKGVAEVGSEGLRALEVRAVR